MKKMNIKERVRLFVNPTINPVFYLDCDVDRKRIDYLVSVVAPWLGISGIDGDGAMYEGGNKESRRGLNLKTINRVAMLLARYSCIEDYGMNQFLRSRNWRSSYGLKHSFEDFSRKLGHVPYYVSNGDFIVAYIIFMHDLMDVGKDGLKKCIRVQGESGSLNLMVRMPSGFDRFEDRVRNPQLYTIR